MDVLITGGSGRVGTAITDHLVADDDYAFTNLDLDEHPDPVVETVVADVTDYDAIRPHFDGVDAVIHLARTPGSDVSAWNRGIEWSEQFRANLEETTNVVGAAVDAGVEQCLYASSNHAVGMHEVLNAPDVYYGTDLLVDHTVFPRPDSLYGLTKVFGEGLGRLAADAHGLRFYALRLCAVREAEYDHPYGDAERGVEEGRFERGSQEYDEQVARMKAMWQSRRDLAQLVDRCLRDESVEFDVFYGASDNDRRWYDVEHAREILGYDPQDNGEEWDAPPNR